jgi:hypothetical protein
MSTDTPLPPTEQRPAVDARRKQLNGRLRAMLVLMALALGLYVFVRLDRTVAERLGPVGEGVYDLFNQVPGKPPTLTVASRRLVKDVEALGGVASVNVTRAGYFGTFGQEEWCNVNVHDRQFDDAALARLAETHGGEIGGLYLFDTAVTDAGLKGLHGFTMLRHLTIHKYWRRARPGAPIAPPAITDAGLAHLKGLDQLWTLDLSDLPITDSGLEAIADLPALEALFLQRTRVQGRGLLKLKSLPRLSVLHLNGSPLTEEGLKALAGATGLQFLSLRGVALSPDTLTVLKTLPRLERLDLTGCGLLDEEVDALVKSRPRLKVTRQ